MKIEPRGKYGGVKIHLEPDECEDLLDSLGGLNDPGSESKIDYALKDSGEKSHTLMLWGMKFGYKIKKLLSKEPDLLTERTPEQVKAILAKEVEKAKIQLATLNATGQFKEINKDALKEALLKHAE